MSRLAHFAGSALFLVSVAPFVAARPAGLSPSGDEVQVNVSITGDQEAARVAAHDEGFVVVWQSDSSAGGDGDGTSIQVRRLDADGVPVGDELQVNTWTTDDQESPSVAAWPDGRFVVVWNDQDFSGSHIGLHGRLFGSDGTPVSGEFEVASGTMAALPPDVAVDADGDGFVVVWPNRIGPTEVAYGQRHDAVGSPVGSAFRIGSASTSPDDQNPRIRATPDGGFVVVWDSLVSTGDDSDGPSVQMRRLDTDGAPIGSPFQVNSSTTGDQTGPSLAIGADGSFVVAWGGYEGGPGDDFGVVARRFDTAGNPSGEDFQVNTHTSQSQYGASAGSLPGGDFVVAWTDGNYPNGDVTMGRFDSQGLGLGDQLAVNALTSGLQRRVSLATTSTGDVLVAWQSGESAGNDSDLTSVQARLFFAEADVGVTKTDGVDAAVPGETVTYTIVATNDGPDAATGVELDDPLPTDLTCDWTSLAGGGATGNTAEGSGDLDETLFLPSGATVTYTLECDVAPQATGNLTNTATILADQVDDTASNDTAFDTDALEPSTDLGFELRASSLDAVAGEETVLVATVRDDGPSSSTGSTATLELPTGLTFAGSADCGHDAGTVTCDLGALDPAEAAAAQVTVLVDGGLAAGIELTVDGGVVADEPDPDDTDDTDSLTLVVATPLFRDGFETGDTSQWSG